MAENVPWTRWEKKERKGEAGSGNKGEKVLKSGEIVRRSFLFARANTRSNDEMFIARTSAVY